MQKINTSGRSMVEMLGVLAIVGVLSVGGYEMISKAMEQHQEGQLIGQTMSLINQARKIVCEYESEYRNDAAYLYTSQAIPAGLTYNSSKKQLSGAADSVFELDYEKGSDDYGLLIIKASNIPENGCLKMVATFWGNNENSKLQTIKVNGNDLSKKNISSSLKVCKDSGNQVELYYLGCFDKE